MTHSPARRRQPLRFTRSAELWARAQQLIANGTQGTRQPLYPEYPAYFERAAGCRMWDVDGNEFIDLLCSIGPVLLGYAYKPVDDDAVAMIRSAFQSSANHPIQLELAERLIDMVPCAERVRYLKTGTDATVAATRLARQITGRVAVARCGYHGWADLWRRGEAGGTHRAAWEVVYPFDGSADDLNRVIRAHSEPFAAVILCPADTRPFTTKNFRDIVEVAHRHGALVIFDEVKTGFRVANGGAQAYLGVTPDLTTLSKGMGNGYPIAAVVGKAEYMEQWKQTPTSGTFFVEAMSLAAANATLRELQTRPVVEHLWKMGQRLIDGLTRICADHGMDEPAAYPDPVPSMPRFTWLPDRGNDCNHPVHQLFFSECFRHGLFFCPWHVAFVGYSHQERDIDEALDICDWAMRETKRKQGSDRAPPPHRDATPQARHQGAGGPLGPAMCAGIHGGAPRGGSLRGPGRRGDDGIPTHPACCCRGRPVDRD